MRQRTYLLGPLLASKLASATTELEGDRSEATPRQGGCKGRGPGLLLARGQQRQHLLCHHADLHTKDTSLFFGRGPLQAHISAGELHGEFHLDLLRGEAGTSPPA